MEIMSDFVMRFLAGVAIVIIIFVVCLFRICCEEEDENNPRSPIDTEDKKRRPYRDPDDLDLSSPPVTIHLLSEFLNFNQNIVSPVLPLVTFTDSRVEAIRKSLSPTRDQRKVRFQRNPSYQAGQDEPVQISNYSETNFMMTRESQVEVHPPPLLSARLATESDQRQVNKTAINSDQESSAHNTAIVKRTQSKTGNQHLKRHSLGNEKSFLVPRVVQMSLKAKLRRVQLYGKETKFFPRSVDNIHFWAQKHDFDFETELWNLFWQEELKNEPILRDTIPSRLDQHDSFLSFSTFASNGNDICGDFDESTLEEKYNTEVLV